MQEKRKNERKRGQISGVQVMFAAILSIGLILAINFSARIAAGQPVEQAYTRVRDEIESLKVQQAQLTSQRDYVLSDAYVEEWARSDGKMVREGEILVIPVPSGASVEATPTPMPEIPIQTGPPDPDRWQLWWSLFFDTTPPHFLQ